MDSVILTDDPGQSGRYFPHCLDDLMGKAAAPGSDGIQEEEQSKENTCKNRPSKLRYEKRKTDGLYNYMG